MKVEIEEDLLICINSIIRKKTPNWKLQAWVEKCTSDLQRLESFTIKHIFRECNIVADQLANAGEIYDIKDLSGSIPLAWLGLDTILAKNVEDASIKG